MNDMVKVWYDPKQRRYLLFNNDGKEIPWLNSVTVTPDKGENLLDIACAEIKMVVQIVNERPELY